MPHPPAPPDTASVQRTRSLFGEILDWMLAPLLVIWPMSVALTWLVAQGIANRPFDRELGALARGLAQEVQAELRLAGPAGQGAAMRLTRTAALILRGDEDDRLFFQVLGPRGELMAGDADLPVPHDDAPRNNEVRYRNDELHDEPVRVAYLWLPMDDSGSGRGAVVQIAETLEKRSQLATEIIKGVILPQFVILPVAVMLVWFALSRGIRPLSEIQQRIRRRDSSDLSPIPTADIPVEVAPLVRSLNELLQRLDESMSTQRHFLADAAHQLKTPLAGLRMQAELAARQVGGDEATMRHTLEQIALSSQRAAHMVNQLLAMARVEDPARVLVSEDLDLDELVTDVVRDFVPKALDRRIDLGYEGPDTPQQAVMPGQPVLLRELVRNLVDNALQYTPAGGTVTARVRPDAFGQVVVLQVEDTGPGIPPAERELVFRAFYRALGTQVDGSGLGLAIVQEIAERHGATVTLSEANAKAPPDGPGALFTVRFPLRRRN